MLSYRHGFHAGNHADVLKHSVLAQIVKLLLQKDKPFTYIDSHAGAGMYRLNSEWAEKTGEATTGILAVLAADATGNSPQAPEPLREYLELCRCLIADGMSYPGSPEVVRALSRSCDRLVLMELHPAEAENLRANFGGDPRIAIHFRDGFAGLRALCPPEPKRGFALVDPSYETAEDWTRAADSLIALNARWPVGTFVLWYPIIPRKMAEVRALKDRFFVSEIPGVLEVELLVEPLDAEGEFGLAGSGLIIVRPPWKLDEELSQTLPWLTDILGREGSGSWSVSWINPDQ